MIIEAEAKECRSSTLTDYAPYLHEPYLMYTSTIYRVWGSFEETLFPNKSEMSIYLILTVFRIRDKDIHSAKVRGADEFSMVATVCQT